MVYDGNMVPLTKLFIGVKKKMNSGSSDNPIMGLTNISPNSYIVEKIFMYIYIAYAI